LNSSLPEKGGRAHWSGGRGQHAGSIELGEGGEVVEAGVKEAGARAVPFIGDQGGGGEVASTGDACRGGDDGAQWWRRDGSGRRGHGMARVRRKAPIWLVGK
jgi:hypothetical protein